MPATTDRETIRRLCTALARIRGGCPPDVPDLDREVRRTTLALEATQLDLARAIALRQIDVAERLRVRGDKLLHAVEAVRAGRWWDPILQLTETRRG